MFGRIARQISQRVEAADRAARLGEGFSGHSLRMGLAAELSRTDASTHEIASQPPSRGRYYPLYSAGPSEIRSASLAATYWFERLCSRGLGSQGRAAS